MSGDHGNITAESMSEDLAAAFLPVTILIGILSVLGLFGNGLVFLVFKFRYPNTEFRIFVLCLALIDFISCLVTLPLEMVVQRRWFSVPDSWLWLCVVKKSVNACVICMSACILALISVDRFRKVCRPLSWQIKPARAIQLCTTIGVIFLFLFLPGVVIFGIQTTDVTYKGQNVTIHTCQRADATKHDLWTTVYIILVFYVPTIVATTINSVIYVRVVVKLLWGYFPFTPVHAFKGLNGHHQTSLELSAALALPPVEEESEYSETPDTKTWYIQRSTGTLTRKITPLESRIRSKTLMLLIVTIVFDISILVYFAVYSVLIQKDHLFDRVSNRAATGLFFFWRLYFFNYVINPVVYGFCDVRFRKCLKGLLNKLSRECNQGY